MKSTLSNMVLVLFVITLISAVSLGMVYNVTKGPIEAAKSTKTTNSLSQVMPQFDNDPSADTTTYVIDGMPIKVYRGTMGGEVSGYAVETMTRIGFSGEIKMMVGLKPDGEIVNIEVLQHKETQGLGSKMGEPGNVLVVSFQGKNPKDLKMSVRKDGGDIDVITASTISSRAYVDAVARGYKAYEAAASGGEIVTETPSDYVNAVLSQTAKSTVVDTVMVDGYPVTVLTALGDGLIGHAVTASADRGVGPMTVMVWFTPEGIIQNVALIENHESPSYAAMIVNVDNVLLASLKGKKASDVVWNFRADGGTIDAVSGATKTSQVYMKAVENAYLAYKSYITREQKNE